MITLHCRTCRRSTQFSRAGYPDVPSEIVRIEYQECNLCGDVDETRARAFDAEGSEQTWPKDAT